jgi:hypothetical protein
MVLSWRYLIERSYNKIKGSGKNGALRAGKAGRGRGHDAHQLLALAAIVVFLT